MGVAAAVALTADGMRQLHADLRALRERRAALTAVLAATAPDDAGGVQPELGLLERRTAELEAVLARATPLDRGKQTPGVVGIGSRVTVRWEADGEETYTIVEPVEIAPSAGRISHESPVGQALMGRRAGGRVAVPVAGGTAWLEIVVVE
jgi:transcription elongation factor GreA